ncbi:MAG: [FeFe] hydrogenase, group A [Patescibacteria group bacterium]|jgi:iron-only hydrogenase group A
MINIKLNNKKLSVREGQTILEIAKDNGVEIPALCYHPDLTIKANCRICVVEIKGCDKLVTACSTKAVAGMEILTESPRVKVARETNLELLFAEHAEKCGSCSHRYDCDLLEFAKKYHIKINRFSDRKKKRKTFLFANAVEIDGTQCIDCRNCVDACARQGINYLEIRGSGANQEIVPTDNKEIACIYCGQCTAHCPAASAQEQSAVEAVEDLLKNKNKIVIAQFAPATRVAIGESFGFAPGTNCEGKMFSALKKLGFNYVFDVNFGADITTMVEAEEFIERINNKKAVWPMMTSCCPAWVAYVEFYHPELIPNLTSARSPHIHLAGALKTYWAKKEKIGAKKIAVISIVPCTAKKYEASRSELKISGDFPVDYVLTTRELSYLIKKNNIDFKNLPDSNGDNIFNHGSGAAAIYGASGGVMESALRTVASFLSKDVKNNKFSARNQMLELKEVRGLKGFKEASLTIAGKKLRVGVINGIANFPHILPKLKKYHYIEVMACPGGCLGGGGQPMPTTDAIRKKRLDGLYNIDKKRSIRCAHENKIMLEYYDWVKEEKLEAKLFYTKFKKSRGTILKTAKTPASSIIKFLS